MAVTEPAQLNPIQATVRLNQLIYGISKRQLSQVDCQTSDRKVPWSPTEYAVIGQLYSATRGISPWFGICWLILMFAFWLPSTPRKKTERGGCECLARLLPAMALKKVLVTLGVALLGDSTAILIRHWDFSQCLRAAAVSCGAEASHLLLKLWVYRLYRHESLLKHGSPLEFYVHCCPNCSTGTMLWDIEFRGRLLLRDLDKNYSSD